MTNIIIRSFSGGEITPSLYGRVDAVKYATGLHTCKNFIVQRYGGITNRPGTGFIAEVKDSTKAIKLIPFVFNANQTYILEFGNLYMRVIKNNAVLTEAAKNITGATQANPCVITIAAHGYSNGNEVYISGVGGMTQLNGRNFKVANVTANTFSLQYMDGTAVNSTAFGAYTSGGTAAKIYEIVTPYIEADLPELNYNQSADIITLVHPSYAPRELARTGDIVWTLSTITFGAQLSAPTGVTATGGRNANNLIFNITGIGGGGEITALAINNGGYGYLLDDVVTVVQSGGSNAKIRIKTVNSVGTVSDYYLIAPGSGYSVASGLATTNEVFKYKVTAVDSDTQEESLPSSAATISNVQKPNTGAPVIIAWSAVTGADYYNVYKELNGQYGWIGIADGLSFYDTDYLVDALDTPSDDRQPFTGSGNYPSTTAFYQQRLLFANTNNNTEGAWTSRSALRKNFMISSPLQNDDAVTFSLLGRQVNEIKHLLDLGRLLIFTTSGEWVIKGDAAGILTPFDINPQQHTYNGSGSLPPLVVGGNALYVQARGSVIRDLGYEYQSDGYKGSELTIYAAHLFDNYTLVDWAYQQIPHSIVWTVRADGTLLGMTYLREHQIFGWHRHETDGTVENVAVIPQDIEDVLYLVVKRTINGKTVKYIEYMKTRQLVDIVDSVFSDCSLSYDGRNTTATTMTLSGGTNWTYDELLTLTASASFFASADVGNQIVLTGSDGTLIRCAIDGYTGGTVVSVYPHKTVPVSMRSVAITTWSKAVDVISGFWHLEGKNISIVGDAFVEANPNNTAYIIKTVTNGSVTLDRPYSVIHAGLPYLSDMQTLNIDIPNQLSSVADKKKNVNRVSLHVESSKGIWTGPNADNLTELKIRSGEDYDEPVELKTEVVDINIKGEWNLNGQIFVRQIDPVPLTILSAIPTGFISGR